MDQEIKLDEAGTSCSLQRPCFYLRVKRMDRLLFQPIFSSSTGRNSNKMCRQHFASSTTVVFLIVYAQVIVKTDSTGTRIVTRNALLAEFLSFKHKLLELRGLNESKEFCLISPQNPSRCCSVGKIGELCGDSCERRNTPRAPSQ